MPLSSKNRFDVLTVENISDFETMEAVQTSEHSPCDMPRTETFRSVRISKNENEPQIESTLSAQFSKNRNTPHIESILSAHISKNGNRPHIETIRSAHFDKNKNELPIESIQSAHSDGNVVPRSEMLRSAHKPRRPKWERKLPERLVIATMETGPTSLKLKVEIETTDTAERKSVLSLLDSGATGELIDRQYAKSCRFNLLKLSTPIPVFNVDGTPNEAGDITEVVDLILRYKNHSERTLFAVSNLGKQKMILGHSWLRKHNPEIDWTTGEVKMSRCPPRCCSGCRDEAHQERLTRKAESRRKDECLTGPSPEINHDSYSDDEPRFEETRSAVSDNSAPIEEGDRLFATGLQPPPGSIDVRTSSPISQRLAEAFKANSIANSSPIPEYLKEFTSVFSKDSFDTLPESREWDHAIEIIPTSKTSTCKVYPMLPAEQKELDVFLKENLETGRIRPSKSPMASPVFFIKKKDGSLRLVQDY